MVTVKSTEETPRGVMVTIELDERGFMPEVVGRSRARTRALAATGFAFGAPSETEGELNRFTEIVSTEETPDGMTRYEVLVDTPV